MANWALHENSVVAFKPWANKRNARKGMYALAAACTLCVALSSFFFSRNTCLFIFRFLFQVKHENAEGHLEIFSQNILERSPSKWAHIYTATTTLMTTANNNNNKKLNISKQTRSNGCPHRVLTTDCCLCVSFFPNRFFLSFKSVSFCYTFFSSFVLHYCDVFQRMHSKLRLLLHS